ncbi:MAG TPA: hypothetical protein VHC69_15200 [Polyangiaceae bacterium]|nr:hypothetical protein [Polyangiaceae bacterium]
MPPLSSGIGGCLAFETLAVRGSSAGASEAGEDVAPLFEATPAIRWRWPQKGWLAVELEGALHVALNEPRFVVVGLGEAHQIPRLAPSLGAALLLRPGF